MDRDEPRHLRQPAEPAWRHWAALAKCSPDTALRDISELLAAGILHRLPGGGRSPACTVNHEVPMQGH
ncbi:MAG: hypothetical protein ACTHOH_18070 [Lysobacteraceae bacterium]